MTYKVDKYIKLINKDLTNSALVNNCRFREVTKNYEFEKKQQVNERVPFSKLENILPLNPVGLSVCVHV